MNRNLIVVAIICVLYATIVNMRMQGISSSSMEQRFIRKFGAHGYRLDTNRNNIYKNYT